MVLRRVANFVGNLFRRGAAPAASQTSATPSSMNSIFSQTGDKRMQKANQDLADAIKTLSGTSKVARPVSNFTASDLEALQNLDEGKLSAMELEALARFHFTGSAGIDADPAKAFHFWELASEKGSIEAQYSRALCFKDGMGTEVNVERAVQDLTKLAEDYNLNLAHYSLAVMFDKGDGIPQDHAKAFHHFKKAAHGGITPALHNIGNAYANGWGVKQSDHNALLYYQAACEAGDAFAHFTVGTWHYQGRGGLEPNKELAFQFHMKAAEAGHPGAIFNVGVAYLVGEGTSLDKAEGVKWLKLAADKNIAEARYNIAKVYMEEEPYRLDEAEAILAPISDRSEIAKAMLEEIASLRKLGKRD